MARSMMKYRNQGRESEASLKFYEGDQEISANEFAIVSAGVSAARLAVLPLDVVFFPLRLVFEVLTFPLKITGEAVSNSMGLAVSTAAVAVDADRLVDVFEEGFNKPRGGRR